MRRVTQSGAHCRRHITQPRETGETREIHPAIHQHRRSLCVRASQDIHRCRRPSFRIWPTHHWCNGTALQSVSIPSIWNISLTIYKVPFVETVRKLILAYKASNASYFLFVGGAGSLHVPGTSDSCVDHPDFFLAYRRAISTSLAHIAYMEERLGIMGTSLRRYRDARIAQRENRATDSDLQEIATYEVSIRAKDQAADFIKAGRTAYMFFDGNTSFKWSFVSPSALYRPGVRTGKYRISVDDMILEGEQKEGKDIFEDRLTGISVADMAIAIADEVERQELVGKHWSAWGDIAEDKPAPAYLRLDAVEGGSV
jgi:putative NADH-flavin reductase